jgi:hypothetical protein
MTSEQTGKKLDPKAAHAHDRAFIRLFFKPAAAEVTEEEVR